jgi:PAS domain S-box-containing protein
MTDGIRVLYVDDDPSLLGLAKIFLERQENIRVETAASAKDALVSLQKSGYDAIVSDYQMPEMDGIDLLKEVRHLHGDIPFILFTGRGREEVVINAINNGADFYLQKGGDARAQFAELVHKIQQAVVRRQAQVELRKAYVTITGSEEKLRQQYNALLKSEQLIRESEARFREFAELMPEIVFETDLDFQVTFVNNRAYSRLGYTPEDKEKGFAGFRVIDPSQHARLRENAARCVRGEPYRQNEYTIFRKDGSTFPALICGAPIFRGTVPVGLRGIVIDISERKEVEDALRESEEKYRTLVEVNQDIIFSLNNQGMVLYVSPQTSEQLGFSPDEMQGRHFSEFIHPDDVSIIARNLSTITEIGAPLLSEQFRIRRKDGTYRWYEDKTISIPAPGGKWVTAGTVRDITKRKMAEDALFESRQMLQTVLDTIPQRVFWKDRNLVYLGCNKPLADDIGYPDPASVVGKTDFDFGIAGVAEKFQASDRDVIASGLPKMNFEESFILPDGRYGCLRTSKAPLRNCDGEIIGVLGTYEDITESKKVQESLIESEARFRDLADRLPQMIFETDLSLRITYMNRHAFAASGITEEEFVRGANILSLIDPLQHEQFTESVRCLLDETPFDPKEYTALSRDGRSFPVMIYSSPIIREKKIAGFRGIAVDISDWKKMEAGVRESEDKFRVFVENANEILFSLDPAGKFTYVSPKWTEMLGHETAGIIGTYSATFIHPSDLSRNIECFRRVMKNGEKISGLEYRILHKDGTWRWHSQSASPVRDAAGTIIAYHGICHDITERKRAEDALWQANRKLSLLSGITRHDINNQLHAVTGFVELLQAKVSDPACGEQFSRILGSLGQIENLIAFTKDYEQIGVQAPVWQQVRELAADAGLAAAEGKVTFINDLPEDLAVYADPLIAKVFSNLVDNALRHGETLSTVRFFCKENDGNRVIVCEDDGEGVAEGEKRRIFEPGVGKNTGFGLSISREILDITGIAIRETGTPGEGARFEMEVPAGQFRSTSS